MLATNSIDKKIITLLPALSPQQKKAVLTVVKTFVKEHTEAWDEDAYQIEMEKRCADYENGTVETFTIQETIAAAKASFVEKQKATNAL
jgi:hypothetical protein